MQEQNFERLDVERVRKDFPIFAKSLPNGRPFYYLDNAASAQKPRCVLEKEREVYERYYANTDRGAYEFGVRVDAELEQARRRVQRFLNAASSDEIVFTSGATMSINMVAAGWGRKFLKPGDEVVVSLMEHHANFVPWQQVATERGARLRCVPLTHDGRLDLEAFERLISERTRLVAVTAMSNVLGTINPVEYIARLAKQVGALVLVDGAQSVPHEATDVQAWGIDFFAFSGHKLFGPTGVGVLWGRAELLEEMDPFLFGGHMIHEVYKERSTWAALPAKFEAGTIPFVQAIALGTAIEYLESLGWAAVKQHEQELAAYTAKQLNQVPGLTLYGPALKQRGPIFTFSIKGAHPEDLAQLLNLKGVFVRHGQHCAMPLHDWLGVPVTVRASLALYNRREDVDALVDALLFARKKLRLA